MTPRETRQIIKTREDNEPVFLARSRESDGAGDRYKLTDDSTCSWAKADDPFGPETLRPRIEPWLTALVQSEHLSLLVGSGLSHAVHGLASDVVLPGMDAITFDTMKEEIQAEAQRVASLAGRDCGNFEDQTRAALELLRGLEIMTATQDEGGELQSKAADLRQELERALATFASAILEGERHLMGAPSAKRELALNYLVSFLMSFASRSGTRDRLHVFTTNYDRYIEAGADVAGLRLIDRFVGSLAPLFRASRLDVDLHYNPPGIRGEPRYLEGVARFTKLHGSVDWVEHGRAILRVGLPFGAESIDGYLGSGPSGAGLTQLMVYPNSAKDRETASYPYVELFRDFAAATCRPNSTLVSYGYGFGDEHINRVLEDILTIPSSHLVVIALNDPLGRIMKTYERLGRHAQITLLIGDHLGNLQALVDHYLPKPAIDRTTFRMAELLKARWGAESQSQSPNHVSAEEDG